MSTQDVSPLRIRLERGGAPVADAIVRIDGLEGVWRTDADGEFSVALMPGSWRGEARVEGQSFDFVLVQAHGVRLRRVSLDEALPPLDDPAALAAMPSEQYEPLRLLGEGGMGRVFMARDRTLGRKVAIKVLHDHIARSERERDDFLAEARALALMESDHLIRVYHSGVKEGRLFLVMQYVEGPDLDALVEDVGPLPIRAVIDAGRQLAGALQLLHENGYIHRDVKPSNSLVDRNGRVRLLDFGLARPLVDFTDPRSRAIGTPAYMSPEQFRAEPLGPATDIYALGATLFHLAIGHPPNHEEQSIVKLAFATVPHLTELRPEVPDDLADVVAAMTSREASERPSAGEVFGWLDQLALAFPETPEGDWLPRVRSTTVSSPAVTRPPSRAMTAGSRPAAGPVAEPIAPPRGRRPVIVLAAVMAALVVVALVALAMLTSSDGEVPASRAAALTPTGEVVQPQEPVLVEEEPAETETVEPPPGPEPAAIASLVRQATSAGLDVASQAVARATRIDQLAAASPPERPVGSGQDASESEARRRNVAPPTREEPRTGDVPAVRQQTEEAGVQEQREPTREERPPTAASEEGEAEPTPPSVQDPVAPEPEAAPELERPPAAPAPVLRDAGREAEQEEEEEPAEEDGRRRRPRPPERPPLGF